MRLGIENRTKIAIGLLLAALVVALWNFGFGKRPGVPGLSAPDRKKANTAEIRKGMLNLALRADLFEASRRLAYLDSTRNIFAMQEDKKIRSPGSKTHDAGKDDGRKGSLAEEKPFSSDLKFIGYFRKQGEPKRYACPKGK